MKRNLHCVKKYECILEIVLLAAVIFGASWYLMAPGRGFAQTPAVVVQPEDSGLHVEDISLEKGAVVFCLAAINGKEASYDREWTIDFRRGGQWFVALEPAKNAVDPGVLLLIPEGEIANVQIDLAYARKLLREARCPAGQYRLRYYDGLYEFALD